MCSCTVWYHKVSRSLMSHVWYVAHAVGCEALVCLIACCRLSDEQFIVLCKILPSANGKPAHASAAGRATQTTNQQLAMQLGQVADLQSTVRQVAESGIPALASAHLSHQTWQLAGLRVWPLNLEHPQPLQAHQCQLLRLLCLPADYSGNLGNIVPCLVQRFRYTSPQVTDCSTKGKHKAR